MWQTRNSPTISILGGDYTKQYKQQQVENGFCTVFNVVGVRRATVVIRWSPPAYLRLNIMLSAKPPPVVLISVIPSFRQRSLHLPNVCLPLNICYFLCILLFQSIFYQCGFINPSKYPIIVLEDVDPY